MQFSKWSFVAGTGSTGQVGQTISGTISGLVEGSNPGTGLTVTVDSTPTGQLVSGGWSYFYYTGFSGDAFIVTGGAVTFAYAAFTHPLFGGELYFGGFGRQNPLFSVFLPTLWTDVDGGFKWVNYSQPTTFTPIPSTPATTPEPNSVIALLGLGMLGLAGRKLKR